MSAIIPSFLPFVLLAVLPCCGEMNQFDAAVEVEPPRRLTGDDLTLHVPVWPDAPARIYCSASIAAGIIVYDVRVGATQATATLSVYERGLGRWASTENDVLPIRENPWASSSVRFETNGWSWSAQLDPATMILWLDLSRDSRQTFTLSKVCRPFDQIHRPYHGPTHGRSEH